MVHETLDMFQGTLYYIILPARIFSSVSYFILRGVLTPLAYSSLLLMIPSNMAINVSKLLYYLDVWYNDKVTWNWEFVITRWSKRVVYSALEAIYYQ